jgi:hypothetical protein
LGNWGTGRIFWQHLQIFYSTFILFQNNGGGGMAEDVFCTVERGNGLLRRSVNSGLCVNATGGFGSNTLSVTVVSTTTTAPVYYIVVNQL